MGFPSIVINLTKIEKNSRAISDFFKPKGILILGVTKACLGDPQVARAMLAGGVTEIGDSRLLNLKRLKESGINAYLTMLRQPMQDEVDEVVRLADTSLVSSFETAKNLSRTAKKQNRTHQVIVMIETGDLREGILPEQALDFVERLLKLENLVLRGIGTNVACLSGVAPTTKNLDILVKLASEIESKFKLKLPVISGGNSSIFKIAYSGSILKGINQIRIGEAILLGQETLSYETIENTFQDAFIIQAEVLEVLEKPSDGKREKRAILALGKQDIGCGELKPIEKNIEVSKISSDHLVVSLNNCQKEIKVGDIIEIIPGYFALLAAMTSPFVSKVFKM